MVRRPKISLGSWYTDRAYQNHRLAGSDWATYRAYEPPSVRGGSAPRPQSERLVTVIMPVFNSASTLERSLSSVYDQLHPSIELIVVDGGSTDGTVEILRNHDPQIHLWFSEPDRGMYDAINKGIALAHGDVTKILNADDLLPPASVVTALDTFERCSLNTCLKGNMALIDEDDQRIEVLDDTVKMRFLPTSSPMYHPTWYIPKQVYLELGPYETRYRIAGDYEYFLRIMQSRFDFLHVDEVLTEFRTGGMSTGLVGPWEGLEIGRHYMGRTKSLLAFGDTWLKKTRHSALRSLLGRRRAERLNARVKAMLRRRETLGSR